MTFCSEAAVAGKPGLIGDLLQSTGIGVEVDALVAAEPHTMRISDWCSQCFDESAFVDRALRRAAETDQKLAFNVIDETRAGDVLILAGNEDLDQRSRRQIDTDHEERDARSVEPLTSAAGFQVEPIHLIRKDARRGLGTKRTWVSSVDLTEPQHSSRTYDFRPLHVYDFANRFSCRIEQPHAWPHVLERLDQIDPFRRVIENDWLRGAEVVSGRNLNGMVVARSDVDDVNHKDAWLRPDLRGGIVSSVWRDRSSTDRHPTGICAVEVQPVVSIRVDRYCATWKADERVLDRRALVATSVDRQPAGKCDRRQWQINEWAARGFWAGTRLANWAGRLAGSWATRSGDMCGRVGRRLGASIEDQRRQDRESQSHHLNQRPRIVQGFEPS